jgi:cytochrome c biogenesis protein CcdA/thiol-disulfide isomerase/thioredoxin
MIVLLAFAFVSGIVTILSPCILPVLPIVLSGGISGGKARPFGVLAGFVASFTAFTLTLSAIVQALGIPVGTLRIVAVVLIVAFGVVMLVPWLRDRFELATSRVAGRGGARGTPRAGFWGGVLVGLGIGLVWTPCVGPIMASVISLALTQHVSGGSVAITLAYTLGTSIPMFGVMIGGRALLARVPALTRSTAGIQKGFAVLMIAVGVAIGFGWDQRLQQAILRLAPNYGSGLTAVERTAPVVSALKSFSAPEVPSEGGVLADYGPAPAFVAGGPWFNTQGLVPSTAQLPNGASMPLDLAALRGKVVVVDFWTYSCVNCVRTLPYLRAWYNAYHAKGLVIVGVHTPEFEFERSTANVARAVRQLGVEWPVVQDNNYAQWDAYGNQYWPAEYFIGPRGNVRYVHYGEGNYATSEQVIRELLAETGVKVTGPMVSKPGPTLYAMTPETYLGYDRTTGFMSVPGLAPGAPTAYQPSGVLANGDWDLSGTWTATPQYIAPTGTGTLELSFDAKNVFLVIQPEGGGGRIKVFVDGKPAGSTVDVRDGTLVPTQPRMYQLVALRAAGTHVLRLDVTGDLRLYDFTFG